jgi:hypothetical protein
MWPAANTNWRREIAATIAAPSGRYASLFTIALSKSLRNYNIWRQREIYRKSGADRGKYLTPKAAPHYPEVER